MQKSAFWLDDCGFVLFAGLSGVVGFFQAAMPPFQRLLYIPVPPAKTGCAGYNTETTYGDHETAQDCLK